MTNSGNSSDTFDFGLSGNNWNSSLNQSTIQLNSGENGLVTVTVAIPVDVSQDEIDIVNLTVTSQGDGVKSETSTVTTTANIPALPPEYDLNLSGNNKISDKGIANGVASLDSSGLVPLSQLGNIITPYAVDINTDISGESVQDVIDDYKTHDHDSSYSSDM